MSFRVVQPERIVLEDGGHAEITRHGSAVLRHDGPIFLGLYDLIELARRCAGSDHELLTALACNMRRGHRFTQECAIDDEEPF